jgi:hypothetical protein
VVDEIIAKPDLHIFPRALGGFRFLSLRTLLSLGAMGVTGYSPDPQRPVGKVGPRAASSCCQKVAVLLRRITSTAMGRTRQRRDRRNREHN